MVVGVVVDPRTQTMEVYRPGQAANGSAAPKVIVLENGDTLTVPELLPGWEMTVESIWAPEFD